MFVLVREDKYVDLEKEIKDKELKPILLFEININSKNSVREQLPKIQELIKELKPQHSAVQITLEKIDNSTPGQISYLHNHFDLVIGLGGLNKVNRYFIEETKIDILQDPQNSIFNNKVNFIHHHNTGLNHILCNIAQERDVYFLFSLNNLKDKKIAQREIGRIDQNIFLSRKKNVNIIISYIIESRGDIKTQKEIENTLKLFNISNEQIKDSVTNLERKFEEKKELMKGVKEIK